MLINDAAVPMIGVLINTGVSDDHYIITNISPQGGNRTLSDAVSRARL